MADIFGNTNSDETNSTEQELLKNLGLQEEEEPKEETSHEEEDPLKVRRRRERRLEERYQREREANIELNARLQALAEARKETSSEAEDFLKVVEPLFGNDTPEKAYATEILQKALKGVFGKAKEEAVREALETIRAEQQEEEQQIAEASEYIDSVMETLEEEYGADFSNTKIRNGYLTFLEKISPKDRDGDLIEYADPFAAYELYMSRMKGSTSRNKEVAARTMTESSATPREGTQKTAEQESLERQLRDLGIL